MWISVLEDEAVLNNLITKYLQKEGYSVRSYLRGEDAVQGLDKPTDLWVIDIMLPGHRRLHRLSGGTEEESQQLCDLHFCPQPGYRPPGRAGAGRGRLHLQTLSGAGAGYQGSAAAEGGRPKTAEVQVGPYTVHLEKHLVYCGSESISLTVKEYDLLLYLAANRGHVLKRGDILDAVWGYTFYGSDRVVDDTIRRLRKKLPGIEISTLYGLGYCLTEERHESLCD